MAVSRKSPSFQVDFDKVLRHVGEYGRYQVLATLMFGFVSTSCALHAMASVFEAAAPDFTCGVIGGTTNEKASSFDRDDKEACTLYRTELVIGSFMLNDTIKVNHTSTALQNETAACNQFRYDTSVFSSTIVTEVRS